jgi:hypothetical protein
LIRSHYKDEALAHLDLLDRVAKHKSVYFRSAWAQYDEAKPGTLRLVPSKVVQSEMRRDYSLMQEMFFSAPPPWDEIMTGIGEFEAEINRKKS